MLLGLLICIYWLVRFFGGLARRMLPLVIDFMLCQVCAGAQSWAKGSQAVYLQSVVTGEHESCPGPPGPSLASDQSQQQAGTVINQVNPSPCLSLSPGCCHLKCSTLTRTM